MKNGCTIFEFDVPVHEYVMIADNTRELVSQDWGAGVPRKT